mgnify:FL=1|tara:strand:- start:7535 stop:8821 length:1287 start_codon:yes stop_codon:yes gene_type:complete
MVDEIITLSQKSKYYEDLYDIFWKISERNKVSDKHYKNISIGLFNTPCGGFGDIIVCKTFYDYLKEWYPTAKISICTTAPQKYKDLGIDGNIYKLTGKDGSDHEECVEYDKLVLKKKVKFDIMVAIPIINKTFDIKKFKKLISYANVFNTFSVSEYNGEYPPYTFPIGVGEDNLGILFNNFKWKQQNIIKKPYALVYIQPSPQWGIHSKYCFLSYLEMICRKYRSKHSFFQVIIPDWIEEEIYTNPNFKSQTLKICKEKYDNISIIGKEHKTILKGDDKKRSSIVFRADILPQKRELFISLMKDSVNDILVTGDQSLSDIISCCNYKNVWYQIAPWKEGLAYNLSKYLPNKNYSTFKTSCGTIKSINTKIEWKNFMKDYDFRINGKKRFDSILISHHKMKEDKTLKNLLYIIEHSRYLETAQKKINKL